MMVAFLLGVVGMQVFSTGMQTTADQFTGMATEAALNPGETFHQENNPGSNLVFYILGVFCGGMVVLVTIYMFAEHKR